MTMIEQWIRKFEQYHQSHELDDKSHDISHFRRVYTTAKAIMNKLGGNELVIATACYFHDIVNLPKNHPNRKQSSVLAAKETLNILSTHYPDFPTELYPSVEHAICAHSFSANIKPETIEAKIVQDADRVEALGAIGLARVFYTAGLLGHHLFDAQDLFAEKRQLDDTKYALDHFQQKLLTLPATMQTAEGRKMAEYNANYLVEFMAKLACEVKGDPYGKAPEVIERFSSEEMAN
ncbi:phosphohydrolase [Legionella sp. W05-934-2]|uniref:phosphohydrolase n=1 Tax=Legionella sp. W05-934-2 TaxID=1198649 RepID=UPI00346282CB